MIVASNERCPCNLPPGAKSASEDKLNVLGSGGGTWAWLLAAICITPSMK